jgi:hypothetical protein
MFCCRRAGEKLTAVINRLSPHLQRACEHYSLYSRGGDAEEVTVYRKEISFDRNVRMFRTVHCLTSLVTARATGLHHGQGSWDSFTVPVKRLNERHLLTEHQALYNGGYSRARSNVAKSSPQ